MAAMKSSSGTGWWLPMLNTRNGAWLVPGSGVSDSYCGFGAATRSVTRITPSTMSSTKVKSRRMFPWLNTSIGRPSRMALVNRNSAMSGRPQGPYTVKKRSPVVGRPNRWL